MRFKATVFLSLLLIFLGAYLFYFELPHARKKEEAEAKAKRIFSLSAASIAAVTIRRPGGPLELEHHPDNPDSPWRVVQPVMTPANDGVASAFASQLETLQSSRIVEEAPTDLKPFGLDPPAYKMVIVIKRGEEQFDTEPLEIGGENLTGNELYVRKGEGSPVYLTSSGIKQYLMKDLKGWRRQELFQFATPDVKRIRIESSRQELDLAREGEEWRIQKPIQEKGDASAVSNLLGTILNLRGEDFIDEKKEEKKKALGAPLLTLRLTVGAVEWEAAFYRVKNEPEVLYAITGPTSPIYKVSQRRFAPLEQPAAAYQEKKQTEKEGAAAPPAVSPSKSKSEKPEPKK